MIADPLPDRCSLCNGPASERPGGSLMSNGMGGVMHRYCPKTQESQ